jgi:lipopolysaccharide biosynthesis glycosyltransferase
MGIFIRNKNKRNQEVGKNKTLFVNTNSNQSIIGEEVQVIDKKSIKTGFGDKNINKQDTKKNDIILNESEVKKPVLFEQKENDPNKFKLFLNKNAENQQPIFSNLNVDTLTTNQNKINQPVIENQNPPEKYAITTILDETFSDYFYVFLNSFLENNTWFSGDIVILYNYDLSFLSNQKINQIKLLYKNIVFKKIETERYEDTINLFKSRVNSSFHRFIPSIFTIEAFNLIEYDKVLYLDSDMLVVNNIIELFKMKGNIIATRDTSKYIRENEIKPINDINLVLNGGFLLLDGDFIRSDKHVQNMLDLFPSLSKPTFLDQSLLNEYFKKFEVLFISSDYNLLKRCFDDSRVDELKNSLNDIKIIHYVGEKPWNDKVKDFEKKYKVIENLWQSYYKRYKHVSEKLNSVTLISSGIDNSKLIEISPKIKNSKTVTTNWGFKYSEIIEINYYYCSTPDKALISEINVNRFKPSNLWLLTDNVKRLVETGNKNKKINNVDPFNLMTFRSHVYTSLVKKRLKNKKLPLPTSGVSMLFFFSLLDISTINLVGYNLYTKKNKDGSYKQHGSSKFINPYNDETKPHNIEFDLNFIIIALNNLINNKVNINFHESEIIEDMYNLINKGLSVGEIITQIKSKYYE